jgi:hypothetical protein
MNQWDLLNEGLTVLSEPKMHLVKKTIKAIKYNAGLAIIDRRTHALMRDYVFDLSCDTETIKKRFAQSPQHVYFLARLIENRLDQCGLRSDLFPDVADKEAFVRLKNDVREIIDNVSKELNQGGKRAADIAVQSYFDLPRLKQAKNAKEAQEFLDGTESKYQHLNKQSSRRSAFLFMGIIGLVLTIIVSLSVLFVIGPIAFFGYFIAVEEAMITEGTNQTIFGAAIIIVLIFLLTLAISLFFLWLGLEKNPESIKLIRLRELARKNLMPMNEWVKVEEGFGELSSNQYAGLIDERLAYLEPFLGKQDKS